MDENLSSLLARLGKPVKLHAMNTRLSDTEFFALTSFCRKTYQSYSDVIREALTLFLKTK